MNRPLESRPNACGARSQEVATAIVETPSSCCAVGDVQTPYFSIHRSTTNTLYQGAQAAARAGPAVQSKMDEQRKPSRLQEAGVLTLIFGEQIQFV